MKVIVPTTTTEGSFTRASSATYVNESGVIATAGNNVLRINYDMADLTKAPYALLEAAATNRILYSEQLDNAAWTKTGVTVAVNSAIAPDGLTTADKLTATLASSFVTQAITATASIKYTFSLYLKADAATTLNVALTESTGGTASQVVVCNVTTVWKRFFVTLTTASGVSGITASIGNLTSFSTGEAVYAWGAQLETATASSYIPTTTVAATRAADVTTNGLLYSNITEPESGWPAWSSATSYSIGAQVTYLHRRYSALRGTDNTNKNPLTDTTIPKYWQDVGPTNRYAMFDDVIGTSTVSTSSNITIVVKNGAVSGISLMQMVAGMVKISVSLDGVVQYQNSLSLSGGIVTDWFEYFNTEIEQVTDYVLTDLPGLTSGVTTIVLSAASGDVSIGNLVLGEVFTFANTGSSSATTTSPTIGINDYSVKIVDDFGRTTLIPRGYAKRMNVKLMLDSESVDKTAKLLTKIRAKACVWLGKDNIYEALIVYGYYKDWEIEIAYTTKSYCSLTIEGLI